MPFHPYSDAQREAAFWAKTEQVGGCLLWRASLNRKGYGNFRGATRTMAAHRWIYERTVGPIPHGMQLDHLCRNRACVNVDHLEPVTGRENQLRGYRNQNGAKATCKYGHPFDLTHTDKRTGHPWRACSVCKLEAKRRYRARKRNELANVD